VWTLLVAKGEVEPSLCSLHRLTSAIVKVDKVLVTKETKTKETKTKETKIKEIKTKETKTKGTKTKEMGYVQ
jgi:hypothetical protein